MALKCKKSAAKPETQQSLRINNNNKEVKNISENTKEREIIVKAMSTLQQHITNQMFYIITLKSQP